MNDLVTQQPDPTPAEGDVWADVIAYLPATPEMRALFEARRQQGIDRYGVPIQRGNLRDARADVIQEVLDAIAYSECRAQQVRHHACDEWRAIEWDLAALLKRVMEAP